MVGHIAKMADCSIGTISDVVSAVFFAWGPCARVSKIHDCG